MRQEQFATQLINEFYQIFAIEKVDCWVNPYEIISTGGNSGIIECIPNSISIDYLKRKHQNLVSLRDFYEKYYGPINSESKIKVKYRIQKCCEQLYKELGWILIGVLFFAN